MYRLMIVDDEPLVLRAISHVVESHCPQIKVVGKTGSGMEAVSLAFREKPDIILMDIELTGLNGLEATEEIKKALPETVIIIISAYDSFQYAQKSISLGVIDYLLKPVSKDDLTVILTKAVTRLDEQMGKTREQLELKEKLNKMKPFLEEDLFFSLLYPGIGRHSLPEYPQLLDLYTVFGQAVEVNVSDCNSLSAQFERYKQLVKNQLSGIKYILFSPIIGRTALILIGYGSMPNNPKNTWEYIRNLFQDKLGISSGIVLGRIYEGFDGLIRSFHELRKSAWLYSYQPGVYHYEEISELSEKGFTIPWLVEQDFFEAVQLGQGELAKLVFNDLLRIITAALGSDLKSLQDYFRGIIAVLRRIFYETAPEQSKQIWDGSHSIQLINGINNPGELSLIFEEIIVELTGFINIGAFPEKNPEIRVAVEYMEKNFRKDINLSDIAAEVAISPGYLTKLFKEYRNQTVMDCLERIRIEQALKLLRETLYSIKEIAILVGYRDPNYFSKVFKKVTNASPTEIRK